MQADPMAWVMDTTWYSSGVLFWHITEIVVGLLGCCLPTYRPLVKRFLPKWKARNRGASSGLPAPQVGMQKYQDRAYYRPQKEEEWPMVRGANGQQGRVGVNLKVTGWKIGPEIKFWSARSSKTGQQWSEKGLRYLSPTLSTYLRNCLQHQLLAILHLGITESHFQIS